MRAEAELAHRQHQIDNGELPPDEPLFVLRAQDPLACGVVRMWCELAKWHGVPQEKIEEAIKLADRMAEWPTKQIPGRPETRGTVS